VAALIALAAMSLFVVSVAIRREERNFSLTGEAPDPVTRAGRWLNGVHPRSSHRTPADRETAPA
jgi:hypothetical protein